MTLYEHKQLHILDKKKPKKKTEVVVKPSEEAIHRSIADYLNTVIKYPSRWCTVEVSNQQAGKAGMFKQMALKRRGVVTGWPDIQIIWWKTEPGLQLVFLEVKVPGGNLTPTQEALHIELRKEGHYVFIVHSIEETIAALKEVGMI